MIFFRNKFLKKLDILILVSFDSNGLKVSVACKIPNLASGVFKNINLKPLSSLSTISVKMV